MKPTLNYLIVFLFSFLLTACDSSNNNPSYTVGGVIFGLSSTGLVLQNNGGDNLSVAGNTFEFPTTLNNGNSYAITIMSQPSSQSCYVFNDTGVINSNNITDVTILCNSATLIENHNENANSPQIAFDANGNGLAVWSASLSIWSNRYEPGIGWGTAEPLHIVPGGFVTNNPQLAVSANGSALAVWAQNGDESGLWSNHYEPGIGWGTPEVIKISSSSSSSHSQISMDASGNGIVVWTQTFGDSIGHIFSNRYEAGSGWGIEEPIENRDESAATPQISMDVSGNAIAVWIQSDGLLKGIWSNHYEPGIGWGTAELVDSTNTYTYNYPQITMNATGNAMAVWHAASEYSTWSNFYEPGIGWGTAELVEINTGVIPPKIAMDADGNVLAMLYKYDVSGPTYYWSKRYEIGIGWGTGELISKHGEGNIISQYDIAVNTNGNALAVWVHHDPYFSESIWSNHYEPGIGWGTAELLELNTEDAAWPQVAIDASGNGLAVWHQYDDIQNSVNIWSNRYEIGTGW